MISSRRGKAPAPILLNIIRILVGVLFIFSGLVKADDPLGLSYKMREFFEIWNEGLAHKRYFFSQALIQVFSWLHEHSLPLAIAMITFEIVAGVALIVGWMMRFFSWMLLLLIVFFTFLTGYAYLSGRFTNCGCFGDCLPITPLTSFLKDVVLTVLILIVFFYRSGIRPLLNDTASLLTILGAGLLSLALQWYVLNYLPLVDCLPYKKGNNIAEKMK
ncbi:MAG TPA: DoxX family protein, partial [Chitinophagaceae bacterium]